MADTILSGDLTVYYWEENRRKQIRWTGGTNKDDVQKMIDIYDASEDLITRATQMTNFLIFDAPTPGEFVIGKIDSGDKEPWFIDLETMEHVVGDYLNFTGCALRTEGWARVQDSNTGIVVVKVTAATNNIVKGDIGENITHADLDAGTLLDVVITGGTDDYLWIRPDSSAAANNWDSATGTITEQGSSKTAVQSGAAVTGEMVWGNVYTQGALVNNTHVYVFQGGVKVTANDATNQDWWVDGHIDRAVPIKDWTTAAFPTLDEGYLTVKANQYGTKYTFAIIRMNTTSGGNVSAGLSSGDQATNNTGYFSIATNAVTVDSFDVGDVMTGGTTGAKCVITLVTGTNPNYVIHGYYIGDPLTAFDASSETVTTDSGGSGTKTAAGPANQGPALTSWFDGSTLPVYSFTSTPTDVNDDGTTEEYGIAIDLNQCSLAQMHEYNKYAHRRGSTLDQDGLDGEEWIGLDLAIEYSAFTATIAEGDTATGATSGATAIVVSFPGGTNDWMLLRNTRGTFTDDEVINFTSGGNMSAAQVLTVDVIVPVAESSFGTLAGTNFFFSRGVVPVDYKSTEENLFQVIDASGTPRQRPTSISIIILNCLQHDYITCWRLTGSGGDIDKDRYTLPGSEAIGDATLDIGASIPADEPGKTAGGHFVFVDVSDNYQEYLLRYSSYNATTAVLTLANKDSTANGASTSTTVIHDTGATFTTEAKVGDYVWNKQGGGSGRGYAYIKSVDSDTQITLDRAITGQVQNDAYELNAVPVAVETGVDEGFIAIAWEYKEADGSVSASMQYIADIYGLVIARNTSDATIKIKSYVTPVTIGTGGGTASVTRIPNTVYGS